MLGNNGFTAGFFSEGKDQTWIWWSGEMGVHMNSLVVPLLCPAAPWGGGKHQFWTGQCSLFKQSCWGAVPWRWELWGQARNRQC